MNAKTTTVVKELLQSPKKIVVVGHKNPDGDAVGSCLGLSDFLNKTGHTSTVVMPNDFPDFLKWLPGCDDIVIYEKDEAKGSSLVAEADVIFTLDFNALDRTGNMQSVLEAATAAFVMIDHHQQPDDYAVATYSDIAICSTSEMVYHTINALEATHVVTPEIATCLYTGIMTDTGGSFRFSTSATTHRVVAQLIEKGARNEEIHQNVYDTNSEDRLKLLGVALNNLTILPEFHTAYIALSQKDLDDHNFKKGDTEGFVNYALSVKDVVFAIIFIENQQESIVKISFRSKGSFSVNEFARTHYNGGGHTNAAGGRSSKALEATITEFIAILPDYKKALIHAT